jgi:hypothetical protein
LQWKAYKIKQTNINKALNYLGIDAPNAWSLRSLALRYYKLKYKTKINSELNLKERILLRRYFFKNRLEVWRLLDEQQKHTDLIKIDFNHMYLMQQTQKLPIKKKQIIDEQEWEWGFYYIKYFISSTTEPILPTWEAGHTVFKTGYGEGVYWVEEIQYHLKLGGFVLQKQLICAYSNMEACLAPLMKDFYKIPNRLIRKQLANQFWGNLGKKAWTHNYSLIKKNELTNLKYHINKSKEYGDYLLIEMCTVKTQSLNNENLVWALVVASRMRIEVHKLQSELENLGVEIVYINADAIIVLKNSLTLKYLETNKKEYKKQVLSLTEFESIKNQQWDLIWKRQNIAANTKRKAWYKAAHL